MRRAIVLLVLAAVITGILAVRAHGPGPRAADTLPHPETTDTLPTDTAVPSAAGASTPAFPTPAVDRPDAAENAAAGFLAAYARPAPFGQDVPASGQDIWWAGVAGLFTADARPDYAGTDPSTVPFTQVTGQGQLLPADPQGESQDGTVTVQVPTDAGAYLVILAPDPTRPSGFAVVMVLPETS